MLLHENKLEESAIAQQLDTTPSGFYALKSRLNTRIQEFFSHTIPDSNIDLLRNVANIPNLLFNSPREIAITHLLKMEKDLIEYDMPFALTTVYSALKKLTRYSQKYFDYSQLYNKHLAYTMTIDKSKDLLADFNKTQGEYLMSRDEKLLEVLGVIRQQMHNYARLYESHHLQVHRCVLDAEYALLPMVPKKEESPVPVEEILTQTEEILKAYKGDTTYYFMSTLIHFLWLQHYRQQGADKKAADYFDLVNERISSFMLTNFCCFPSLFLMLKVEWYLTTNQEKKLYEEGKMLASVYSPDMEDAPNYINYIKYQAIAAYYQGRCGESVTLLNDLLNDISFRNFPHAEIEVKLFLALCYLLTGKTELSSGLVKNVQRKIRDTEPRSYENARVFAKMLFLAISHPVKDKSKKLLLLRADFGELNRQPQSMLEFLRLDNAFVKSLSLIPS